MKWEPSVRTRHLTVIIFLIIVVTGALVCFNIARLLNAQTSSRKDAVERLTDQMYTFAQQAINNRPLEEPKIAIALDDTVRSLIKASTGETKDFIYCALISTDGAIIAQSDPLNLLHTASKVRPVDQLQTGR